MQKSVAEQIIESYPAASWRFVEGHGISAEFIKEHPSIPWDWDYVTDKSTLSVEDVITSWIINANLSWSNITYEMMLDMEFILANDRSYNKDTILSRMNSIDAIIKNLREKTYNDLTTYSLRFPCYITRNPHLTMETMIANPLLPIDWYYIHRNKNVTFEFVNVNRDKLTFLH